VEKGTGGFGSHDARGKNAVQLLAMQWKEGSPGFLRDPEDIRRNLGRRQYLLLCPLRFQVGP